MSSQGARCSCDADGGRVFVACSTYREGSRRAGQAIEYQEVKLYRTRGTLLLSLFPLAASSFAALSFCCHRVLLTFMAKLLLPIHRHLSVNTLSYNLNYCALARPLEQETDRVKKKQ